MEPNQMTGQPQQMPTPQGGGMKTVWAIIVLLVVIIGGWYVYKSGAFNRGVENAPEISREQIVGEAPISQSLENAIEKHKKEILDRVYAGTPLTDSEREALSRTMLLESHLYKFTDEELRAISKSIQPPQSR